MVPLVLHGSTATLSENKSHFLRQTGFSHETGFFYAQIVVMERKIWYIESMDTTIQTLSSTEKHNAMISYCFLAPFMLMSREERFKSDFIRSHARYATLLHIGFLILIVSFVRSRNFSSTILYDMTWVHGVLFVLFFVLLFLL